MYSSMWCMSIVALLVVDVRTGALQDRDMGAGRCYECSQANGTACQHAGWPAVTCPADRPLCATIAVTPDFSSSLTCAAASEAPCSLTKRNNLFELTCVCSTHLCNAPFSSELQNELLNFSFTLLNNSNNKALTFFQTSKFKNVAEKDLYKTITIGIPEAEITVVQNSSQLTTVVSVTATINTQSILRDSEKPRAEPLKQEPTVPSDDDEDDGEGSGAYEESRIHNHAVSAPAAPSSFLPANENSAAPVYKDLLVTILFIYFVV